MDTPIPSTLPGDDTTQQNSRLKNWAGNITYDTTHVHYPTTLAQVQEVVRRCANIKALGSRHSFNHIADSNSHLVSLQAMERSVSIDKAAHTVTVDAGTRYGDIAPLLHDNGYALPNLASLPHITVAGACATATHGSGLKNGVLSTSVSAIEFVNAHGDVITLSKRKDGDLFQGAVVNLGALGVMTKLTLDLVPTFLMKQEVYCHMPMAELKEQFENLQARGYSISLFTDWQNKSINEVWIKTVVKEGETVANTPTLYKAEAATQNMHPIEDQSAENVTDQLGVPGPWYERMPHFKMGFKPSAGTELQSEYFVPLHHAYDAMMAIEKLKDLVSPHLFISEIRTIAADTFWLSPCYNQATVAFHFTWKQHSEAVMQLLPLIEEQLAPYNPRPHWAKIFTLAAPVLQSRYPRLADFKELVQQLDPKGKFRNAYLERNFFS